VIAGGAASLHAAGPVDAPARAPDVFGGYPSTQIIVQLRPTVARALHAAMRERAEARRANKTVTAPTRRELRYLDSPDVFTGPLQRTWRRWGATRIRPVFSGSFLHSKRGVEYGLDRMFVVEVPAGTDTPAMARAFAAHAGEVEAAGVDSIGGVAACPTRPNDDRFAQQWNMHNTGQTIFNVRGTVDADVDAPEAWEITTGEPGATVIAILDSGVYPHADFADRLLPGYNSHDGSDDTADYCLGGHGTHVTGIAAATGNNGYGVAGMNWGTSILPVKVLFSPPVPCDGASLDLARGIEWVTDWPCLDQVPCEDTRRVDVINMSLQYYISGDPLAIAILTNAVNMAHEAGIVLVAATGNFGAPVAYPAKLENVVAVGMTTHRDAIDAASNHGPEVDVSAPGSAIYSTFRPSSNFGWLTGTSMASPHVAGLATLLRSLDPAMTNVEIKAIIEDTVDDKGSPGWDEFFGSGRINAHTALATAVGGILSSTPAACTVDAARPFDPDNQSVPLGLQSFDLTFPDGVMEPDPADFAVAVDGGTASAPGVAAVTPVEGNTVRVDLDAVIEPKAWTSIEHLPSGTAVRLGFLPADANGDGVSNTADIFTMLDNFEGVGQTRPLSSLDIDRSGSFTTLDMLEMVDLLVGAGAYEEYFGATLPP